MGRGRHERQRTDQAGDDLPSSSFTSSARTRRPASAIATARVRVGKLKGGEALALYQVERVARVGSPAPLGGKALIGGQAPAKLTTGNGDIHTLGSALHHRRVAARCPLAIHWETPPAVTPTWRENSALLTMFDKRTVHSASKDSAVRKRP